MGLRIWIALGGLVLVGMFAQPAAAAPTVVYDCAPAPRDCTGWYRSNVTLDWTVLPASATKSGCTDETLTTDTKGTYEVCSATDGTRVTVELWIAIDKTPPLVTNAFGARPPDANGWYHAPVGVTFGGDDATSGVRRCTTATYTGPETAHASVSGTCTDVAGNTSAVAKFLLRYDVTGPDITRGRAARKPDHGRWYNHPVVWRFRGRDKLSGLSECPKALYTGPNGRPARVVGACVDKAGNVSTRSFPLRYDSTPPATPTVRAVPRDRRVKLAIGVARDVRRISIVRRPGLGDDKDSTLYRGRPRNFTDWRARNGKRYHYTVVARDQAANGSRTTVSAVPHVDLIAPPDGATLGAPPLLRWMAVRDADYYNVQLRRDGRKVLSRWPSRPRLQLTGTWHFGGQVRHLSAGTYSWDVWPGFGPRLDARYGKRIGGRTFVIPAASPAR
ncbi:MAG TPA: hypothetical protein VFX51_27475 [Solirubrobacteraceae bacterium]|nr:hypothetical protein [Solirubrobacteraceae bacterium]